MSYKVTIIMSNYNQEKYISQAIESVLNQKTNFPFQLIITDDFSTKDNSIKIIKEFEKKEPNIIKVLYNKENGRYLKNILRKSMQLSLFILAPIMVGLALVADNFVIVILTEKWMKSVPYIQIFCIYFLTRPIETSAQQAILAIGRSDIVLRIMIIINCVSIGTLLIASFVFHSVLLIALGSLLSTLVSLGLYLTFSNRLINYRLKEQIEDILPTFISIIVMAIGVIGVSLLNVGALWKLIIQIIVGMVCYILASLVFQKKTMGYVIAQIKKIINK